jgi:hypothetical protein
MPYIHPDDRLQILSGRKIESAGELNYVITNLINDYILYNGKNYNNLNEVIGVLECAKLELYRRIAAPYEDIKIEANGDVYTV